MVSDPEHVKTGPTFPAYGPANEFWTARVADDDYYVGDVGDAMTVQSQLIRPNVGPVRYPVDSEIGATSLCDDQGAADPGRHRRTPQQSPNLAPPSATGLPVVPACQHPRQSLSSATFASARVPPALQR